MGEPAEWIPRGAVNDPESGTPLRGRLFEGAAGEDFQAQRVEEVALGGAL